MSFTDIYNVLAAAFPHMTRFSVRAFSAIDGGNVGLDNGDEHILYELTVHRSKDGDRQFSARSPEACIGMAVQFAAYGI